MDGMLSQEEIDALLAQAASGAAPLPEGFSFESEGQATKGLETGHDVKLYDFKRPEKFSREQLRGLERIHERLARLWSTTLSAYVRTNIIVRIESVTPLSYQDFVFSLPQQTLIHVVQLEPLSGQAALEINPSVVFAMYEQMMGGHRRTAGRVRPLTDVELVLFQRPLDRMLHCICETWQDIVPLRPRLVRAEQDPQFAQVAATNAPVIVVSFECAIGDEFGMMSLCLPDVLVDELLRHLGQDRLADDRGSGDRDRRLVRETVADVRLPVAAVLGRSRLTIEQVRGLSPGDVVRLDTELGDDAAVWIGDQVVFRAAVGRVRQRIAVELKDAVHQPAPMLAALDDVAAEQDEADLDEAADDPPPPPEPPAPEAPEAE